MTVGFVHLWTSDPNRLAELDAALEIRGWKVIQAALLDPPGELPPVARPSLALADLGPQANPSDLARAQAWAAALGLPLVCRAPARALGRLLEQAPAGPLPGLVPEHWPAPALSRALAQVLESSPHPADGPAGESIHQAIVTNLRTGILVIQDEVVRFANPWMCQFLGLPMAQVLGRGLLDFIDPQFREMVRERHHQRLAGKPVPESYRLRVLDSGGGRYWVQINAMLFPWENKPAALVFFHDISEEVQIQRDLREKEERLRALVENIPGMAYRCELLPPWRMHHISDAALAITGFPPEDFLAGRVEFGALRSEERRVGKEGRSRWSPYH